MNKLKNSNRVWKSWLWSSKKQPLQPVPRQKRTFLLFEILLAFSLVALCAIPLVSQPLKLYRSEIRFLEQMERERLADWTFTEIKEALLKNQLPWDQIPSKGGSTEPFLLPPSTIQIPGSPPKRVQRSYTLHCKGEKPGLKEETYRTLIVKIQFSPSLFPKKKSYTYRLLVKRVPSGPIPLNPL